MDIVERVARALYDLHDGEAFDTAEPTYDELDDHIKGWYTEQAETAIEAAGVRDLVEALEAIAGEHMERTGYCQSNCDMVPDLTILEAQSKARTALARYRGDQ